MSRRLIGLGIAAAVAAVVLGSSALTGASWTDAVDLDGGVVQSGELSLLTGDGENQVSDYDFTELAAADLGPGEYAQAPLVVSNGGSADLRYRLNEVTLDGGAGVALLLTASTVGATADCPTGRNAADPTGATELFVGPPAEAGTDWRPVAVDDAEVLCLRVGADPDTQPDLDDPTRLVFTFAAEST